MTTATRVIGLELSLASTGVASSLGWTDRIVTKPDQFPNTFARLRHIRAQVLDHTRTANLVVVEQLAIASQTGQHLTRAGLWHMVMEAIDAADIPWTSVTTQQLKKYATGKGNASKDATLLAVAKRFPHWDITGNDEADALTLAAMGSDHLGHPLADMPQAHREALDKVTWPEMEVAR
jgi:crossover junction endodeoxyribonuclease RuvC